LQYPGNAISGHILSAISGRETAVEVKSIGPAGLRHFEDEEMMICEVIVRKELVENGVGSEWHLPVF
jgi:hypothetical protein